MCPAENDPLLAPGHNDGKLATVRQNAGLLLACAAPSKQSLFVKTRKQ